MMSPKEMIEVIQAFERGEKIESKLKAKPPVWTLSKNPLFDFSTFDYRVAPKPKCKVKFYAAVRVSDNALMMLPCSNPDIAYWIRVPALDTEVEIDE